jgi:Alternate to MurJ
MNPTLQVCVLHSFHFAEHPCGMPNLAIILVLTAVVHCLDTASYASRIAGVRTGRLALTGALFNIVSLASRVAYTLQAPLLGSAVDRMVHQGQPGGLVRNFHIIIGAATVGTLLGAMLIPTFTSLFARAAVAYETHGSFPALLLHTLSLRGFSRISQHLRLPLPESVRNASRFRLPNSFLLLNIIVTAVYTVGISSTMYASALAPGLARTATTLSGVINGVGTLLLVLLIDPVSALITDQALRGRRPLVEVSHIVIWQVAGRFIGTLLAQLLFLPAAQVVVRIARLLG